MKQINKDLIEKIKDEHLNYCSSLPGIKKLSISNENMRILFIEDPFDFNLPVPHTKFDFIQKYKNYDFEAQYNTFRKSTNKIWNGVELIKTLNVQVCPYCGINYFSTVSKYKGNKISVATFDHYLPKETYGMLALNLYNLVPCCKNCNSTFKGKENKLIVHPFFYSIEENIKFKLESNKAIEFILDDSTELKINIESKSNDAQFNFLFTEHEKVIALKSRYEYFQGIAKSTIKKKMYYNQAYIEELTEYPDLNLKEDEIKQMLLRQDIFNEDEPFLKFKNDIWDDFNV